MNSARQSKSSLLLILALVFIAPVALAKLLLSMHWYQAGVTNNGQLLPEPLSYKSLKMNNPLPHKWQIVYLLPENCDAICQQQLFILHQSHLALGKEQDRVIPVVFHSPVSDTSQLGKYQFTQAEANSELAKQLNQQQMIVVDPLGKLVMRYVLMSDKHQRVMQGRAMLSDLQKLLKLSRIG